MVFQLKAQNYANEKQITKKGISLKQVPILLSTLLRLDFKADIYFDFVLYEAELEIYNNEILEVSAKINQLSFDIEPKMEILYNL